jgi:protein O-mannosyl-transferase
MARRLPLLRFHFGAVQSHWRYGALVGLAFFVYFRALFFDYTWLDDNVLILDNQWLLKDLTFAVKVFTREVFNIHASSSYTSYYRPLLTLSFMFDAQFGGTAPYMYHLTNLLLHMVAACLVFYFLKLLGIRQTAAFVLSMVFTAHPALSQAVAWIPGRNDSLLAVFVLSAMIMLIRYLRNGKFRYLLAHGLFFACGLFTKESMIFTPILSLVLIALCFYLPTLAWISPCEINTVRKRLLTTVSLLVIWCIPITVYYILRKIAIPDPSFFTPWDSFRSLWNNAPALLLYLGKLFFPVNLTVMPTLRDSTLGYGAAAAAVLCIWFLVAIFRSRTGKRVDLRHSKDSGSDCLSSVTIILFGLVWFIGFLIPSFLKANPESTADFLEHRMYVSSIGLLIVLSQIGFIKNVDFKKHYARIIAGACIYTLSLITLQHMDVFMDPIAFYSDAVKHSPHRSFAHTGLGTIYYLDGKPELAENELRTAIQLNPQETMAHNCLGLIYQSRGDYLNAQEEFKKELALKPDNDVALFNWGSLCYVAGNKKDAELLWQKTLEANPDYIEAMKKLYSFYHEIGDTARMRSSFEALKKRGVSP